MNKSLTLIFSLVFAASFFSSCGGTRELLVKKSKSAYKELDAEEKRLADTLIKRVLDNEGLFTVMGRLKPMSSVTELNLKLANPDTANRGAATVPSSSADISKLMKYNKVVKVLKFDDLNFMISPYKITHQDNRGMQISVNRPTLVDSLLTAKSSFFGQFGFAAGTSPEIVINTTEYEHKYARFRAYGYLFGYPDHAVDFFTAASISADKTGEFVKRSFIQIPVYSSSRGRFVYAVPLDYQPQQVDEGLRQRAAEALQHYTLIRQKFVRADGSVDYYHLLLKLLKNGH